MQNLTYSLETSVPVFQLDFFKQLANCEWENIMNNFTWHDHIHRSYMVYFITVSEDLNIYTCYINSSEHAITCFVVYAPI